VIQILRADITTLHVDAIVNAANAELFPGGGVSGAIHRSAGPMLAAACRDLGGCPIGGAVLTPGFALPARYVIHAVGPIWRGGGSGEADTLRRTYERIFTVAHAQADIRSLAIPAISTGIYGFPKADAAAIAVTAMRAHERDLARVIACLFDDESVRLYESALARPA